MPHRASPRLYPPCHLFVQYHPKLPFPLIATSIEGYPDTYNAFEDEGRPGLFDVCCLNSKREFPNISDELRESLFSNVKHYKPKVPLGGIILLCTVMYCQT